MDRIIRTDYAEVVKRIEGGNGGAAVRIAFFLGEGRGRGGGQHYTPIFIIFFFVT
jgi:hypothetical protein